MARQIVIDFDAEARQLSLTHRVRNFGETLYHTFKNDGRASISLEEVDRATTRLLVAVHSAQEVRRTSSLIEELLDRHHLAPIARLSHLKPPS